jgi:hypothetical protein
VLDGCPISEIIKFINCFPKSFLDDMKESLQAEILEKEILSTLSSFQKYKIPGIDGLMSIFFLGFYDFVK